MNKINKVIGLMSGTSLDGVDIAFCEFVYTDKWEFSLVKGETIPYDSNWRRALEKIHSSSAESISEMNISYGAYLGELVKIFCNKHKVMADFISSHGHTIFHQPEKKFTMQIGSGAAISAVTSLPVVCDFRSLDVSLGGQGAPLVPVGDKYLFGSADYCLNLGGIANISFDDAGTRIAFDICPCNLVLNHYASMRGMPYDKNGELAAGGKTNESLLERLNNWQYYKKKFPKSLGREDIENEILPLIDSSTISVEDVLATFCNHISIQISNTIGKRKKILITGGGAFNNYLMKCITEKSGAEIIKTSKEIIEYKEAIIFAFLGLLRMRNEINCFKSVTGASRDSSGGAIYYSGKT